MKNKPTRGYLGLAELCKKHNLPMVDIRCGYIRGEPTDIQILGNEVLGRCSLNGHHCQYDPRKKDVTACAKEQFELYGRQ